MEILEAFDLTGTLRGAAELAGCDHKTVAHWVRAREEAGGGLPVSVRPRPRVDAFAVKIEEWVDRSRGRIRADVAHQRLVAMGYLGSERTTRRAVAAAKRRWRAEHGRRFRPWVTEPGLWMQWDYGDGPRVAGRSTVLFCAWLAWSRFRVVVPLWDRTMPSVVMALDRALRAFGGAPTYALTDNERTVSITIKRATTSCAFAENVFYGYWKAQDQGDDAFTAYSPVTKQSYSMSCGGETTVVCRTGDGAEVRFPMAAIRAYTAENAAHYAATHDTGPSKPADGDSASPGDDSGSGGGSNCDPNYEGQCLDPSSPDYDCEGGSGDGPDYTGPVTVVGDDHFGLDRDGDGSACE